MARQNEIRTNCRGSDARGETRDTHDAQRAACGTSIPAGLGARFAMHVAVVVINVFFMEHERATDHANEQARSAHTSENVTKSAMIAGGRRAARRVLCERECRAR